MADVLTLLTDVTEDTDGPIASYAFTGDTVTLALTGSTSGGVVIVDVLDPVKGSWVVLAVLDDASPTMTIKNVKGDALRARLVGSVWKELKGKATTWPIPPEGLTVTITETEADQGHYVVQWKNAVSRHWSKAVLLTKAEDSLTVSGAHGGLVRAHQVTRTGPHVTVTATIKPLKSTQRVKAPALRSLTPTKKATHTNV